jgi:small subunit ribosomal protein S21
MVITNECIVIFSAQFFITIQESDSHMPSVSARDEESIDSLIRRLKRIVERTGIHKELRKREFFQKPSKIKQRAMAAAKKRYMKKISREQAMMESQHGRGAKRSSASSSAATAGRGGRGGARGATGTARSGTGAARAAGGGARGRRDDA